MKMKISILIILSLFFFSCKDNTEKKTILKNESSTLSLYLDYFNDKNKVDSLITLQTFTEL